MEVINTNEYHYTESVIRDTLYSDVDLRFINHPMTGDINRLKEVEAVKTALKNLILTEAGERPFNPDFGVPFNSFLFDLISLNPNDFEDQVIAAINRNEKRVKVKKVDLKEQPDLNAISLVIEFSILNLKDIFTVEVNLRRTK